MKKSKVAIIICVLAVVLALWYAWIYQGLRHSYTEDPEFPLEEYEVDELLSGVEVHQTFIAKERYLKGAAFYLINLPEDRTGLFNVEIRDKSGKTIAAETHKIEDWTVDEWEWFDFDERLSPNKEYEFVISLTDYSGEVVPLLIRINDVAMRFRYAIPASVYEKMAYTFIMAALLYLIISILVSLKMPDLAGKFISGISLAGIFILYVPNIAYKLQYINLDDSWRYFLNVASPRGYVFGKDIIFTYGPLGYLCYMMNLPENKPFFWAGVTIWTIVTVGFIYLLIKLFKANVEGRLSTFSLVVSFIVAFASYKVIERDNFLLYMLILSVLVYDTEMDKERPKPLGIFIISNMLLTIMFFAKFSTFSSGFVFIVLYTAYKWIFTRNWRGIFLAAPAFVTMPLGYLIYNPSISDLLAYVRGFINHSNDWMESWQYDVTAEGVELVALVVIMTLYVVLMVLSIIRDYKSAGVVVALSASMFFVYKYATTRHGLPCGIWLFGMMYSIVPLVIGRGNKQSEIDKKKFGIPVVLFSCVFVTGLLEANVMHNTGEQFVSTLQAKAHNWTHLSEIGIEDTVQEYVWNIPESVLNTIGNSTVCVYPYKVALDAAYPTLNMVFYPTATNGAGSEWSDRLVADWYASDKGAEYLIMDDETVDNHIKFLENPLTWEAIESNYTIIGRIETHCILKKNDTITAYEKPLKLIKDETVAVNGDVIVPDGADYVKIYTDYSLLGKIKKFFYHVGTLNMSMVYDDGTGVFGRIIRGNLSTGFELCEYPQNTDELVEYMINGPKKSITSFRIVGPGLTDLNTDMRLEWYSFE